jgi:hypothetical protein
MESDHIPLIQIPAVARARLTIGRHRVGVLELFGVYKTRSLSSCLRHQKQ